MGTKKYPGENDYSQYLSSNSGHSNAYTASTSTNYYFDVSAKPANDEDPSESNPSPLLGGLDRFSQFFVQPLFLESTLDRELKAVDSENKRTSKMTRGVSINLRSRCPTQTILTATFPPVI